MMDLFMKVICTISIAVWVPGVIMVLVTGAWEWFICAALISILAMIIGLIAVIWEILP